MGSLHWQLQITCRDWHPDPLELVAEDQYLKQEQLPRRSCYDGARQLATQEPDILPADSLHPTPASLAWAFVSRIRCFMKRDSESRRELRCAQFGLD